MDLNITNVQFSSVRTLYNCYNSIPVPRTPIHSTSGGYPLHSSLCVSLWYAPFLFVCIDAAEIRYIVLYFHIRSVSRVNYTLLFA
jgi:hypothetical protein